MHIDILHRNVNLLIQSFLYVGFSQRLFDQSTCLNHIQNGFHFGRQWSYRLKKKNMWHLVLNIDHFHIETGLHCKDPSIFGNVTSISAENTSRYCPIIDYISSMYAS